MEAAPVDAIGLAITAAVLVRALMALLKTPFGRRVYDRIPEDARPLVPWLLGAAAAGLDAYAGGGGLLQSLTVGLGAVAGSGLMHDVPAGRAKRRARAGSISLDGR